MRFFNLKVKSITKETPSAIVIELDISNALLTHFSYIPGQYLTFKLFIDGKEYRRSYSICSTPYLNQNICVAVKEVSGGKVSTYLNNKLKVGDELQVMIPEGRFTIDMDKDNERKYVFFAGGSGITPIISIIHSLLLVEPKSDVVLYYGNFDENSIIFKSNLDKLALQFPNFRLFYVLEEAVHPSDDLLHGRLTKEKVSLLLSKRESGASYFICGPTPMMQNVEEILTRFNIPKEYIYVEYFTSVSNADLKEDIITIEEIQERVVRVILDGVSTEISYLNNKLPILEAALDAGLDAPYSCQQAVCCSCRAKLIEGEVSMKNNYALSEEEIADGFILTCQSIPLSAVTIVNYDL